MRVPGDRARATSAAGGAGPLTCPRVFQSWTDHYLQWNVSEYPGVKTVRFPDGQIWKPDILLYNR